MNPMISFMNASLVQMRIWIDCPACGRLQKLVRDVVVPVELTTPALERACAVCERCRGIAVMCFERHVGRLH
jgi:phage terminase large subunit GpA-like protein